MKTAIGVGGPASGQPREFAQLAAFAVEAEKLGVDSAWSAEAWGYDAVSILAYLAAKTERLVLGSGILQISARAPSMTAMTAMALAALSGNRFILGLGASGPQVVEGLHGVPFAKPLARMRETIEIVRLAFRGEPLRYAGEHHVLPLPGGEGKALRLAQPAEPEHPDLPRHALAEGARAHRRARRRLARHLVHARGRRGAPRAPAARRRARGPHARRPHALRRLHVRGHRRSRAAVRGAEAAHGVHARRDGLARRPTSTTTPIAAAASRTPAIEVQRLWIEGKREEAARRVPDEMILRTTLIGPESRIRERLRAYRAAGIGMMRIEPLGADDGARLDALGRAVELVRQES